MSKIKNYPISKEFVDHTSKKLIMDSMYQIIDQTEEQIKVTGEGKSRDGFYPDRKDN